MSSSDSRLRAHRRPKRCGGRHSPDLPEHRTGPAKGTGQRRVAGVCARFACHCFPPPTLGPSVRARRTSTRIGQRPPIVLPGSSHRRHGVDQRRQRQVSVLRGPGAFRGGEPPLGWRSALADDQVGGEFDARLRGRLAVGHAQDEARRRPPPSGRAAGGSSSAAGRPSERPAGRRSRRRSGPPGCAVVPRARPGRRRVPGGRCPRRWPSAGPAAAGARGPCRCPRRRGTCRGSRVPDRPARRPRPWPRDTRRVALGCTGSTGPPMTPMRRCPSPSRCRVAVRPPFQFVAPTDGVSWSGSPVGSTTT